MTTWWAGTRLVFSRALRERLRSRSFKILTAFLAVISAAFVILPLVLAQQGKTYTVATVGQAQPALVAALNSAGKAGDFQVNYIARERKQELQTAVRNGDATVGLAGDSLYSSTTGAGTFPAVVAQAALTLKTSRLLLQAGLSPQQVAELRSLKPPTQIPVGALHDQARGTVALAAGAILMMALLFAGTAIATAVALEKSSRISEVLLTVLRPSQFLVGDVLAVGTVTFIEFLVLTAPVAVAVQVNHDLGLPSVATGDIALALLWLLLGFALYGFLYAAGGALIDKVTEVENAVLPIAAILTGAYMVSYYVIVMGDDVDSPVSVLLSVFPITAPLAMPLRWASGDVPAYQLMLAMGLTAATAVAGVWLASTIYTRALRITGHRVRLRELIGRRAVA